MANAKPLLLVDGSSYLFRAYHALPDLRTSDGAPTGAVRGVIAMLRKLSNDYAGSPIAVVFDAGGKTFRDELFPEYKANRPPMPDDLREQIGPIHDVIRAMGLPLIVCPGVEADDVIGTLATRATQASQPTIISTSDKDMAQLVNDHVSLVNTMTDTNHGREGVWEKFGVWPEQIIDYLALMGDTSDNIPGVPKVGPKTAAKWLDSYGDLDGVIANANEIKGKVGESLRDSLEQLPLSRTLATIKCDVDIDLGLDDLSLAVADTEALRILFKRFEFKSWLAELDGASDIEETASASGDYRIIDTVDGLKALIEEINEVQSFAIEIVTGSSDYMDAEIVGIAIATRCEHGVYIPIRHQGQRQLDQDAVLEHLGPIFEDSRLTKMGHDLKFQLNVLARNNVVIRGLSNDTMLESYVFDSVGSRGHKLEDLTAKYSDTRLPPLESVVGKGAKRAPWSMVEVEAACQFAAQRADAVLRLDRDLRPQLEAKPALMPVYEELELPLLVVLSEMERAGTLIDAAMLAEQSKELSDRMVSLQAKAFELAGEEFNLGSPKQLQEILYDKLSLPALRKTQKGQRSTAEPVLQELAQEFELPQVILDYRSVSKLKSTYTDALPGQINGHTGRVHTSYHQAVTATGRLSSSDPNLQNIPIRTGDGRKIRQAFVAPEGFRLVAADYSQIELRIMAHLSGDAGLCSAFAQGLDVHRATASEVFAVDVEAVNDEQRRSAKAINFGLIYGMSAFGLGRQLGIARKVAQEYIDRYFERYPNVRDYMDQIRSRAAEDGFVETAFGRRLYLPEINARNVPRRQAAERAAINAPMQGTAADIIKRAMLAVDRCLRESPLEAKMVMQVHDELVFEVAEEDVAELITLAEETMTSAASLDVPLVVDTGVGINWNEAH
ncbi:MAG: DNA polymerase I [Pseudomonadota bacterium]|nr:DNA polymerase I [Pseudomonadota bacterium]